MENAPLYLTFAATTLIAISMIAVVGLRGFTGWLDLKRAELDVHVRGDIALPSASNRIEIADLKERLRKLEAIAAGVDL
ncbi:MAG: hypothetical protein ABL918_12645 [Chakrabartia sp.]